MPPEKVAELGHAMSAALAAAVAANPNDNVAVHRALWNEKLARIAELEAALRPFSEMQMRYIDEVGRVTIRVDAADIQRAAEAMNGSTNRQSTSTDNS